MGSQTNNAAQETLARWLGSLASTQSLTSVDRSTRRRFRFLLTSFLGDARGLLRITWICVACSLNQSDIYLIIYIYASCGMDQLWLTVTYVTFWSCKAPFNFHVIAHQQQQQLDGIGVKTIMLACSGCKYTFGNVIMHACTSWAPAQSSTYSCKSDKSVDLDPIHIHLWRILCLHDYQYYNEPISTTETWNLGQASVTRALERAWSNTPRPIARGCGMSGTLPFKLDFVAYDVDVIMITHIAQWHMHDDLISSAESRNDVIHRVPCDGIYAYTIVCIHIPPVPSLYHVHNCKCLPVLR